MTDRIGIVAIGRNEGERLKACLASVAGRGQVVYVDSGSSDGSPGAAARAGADVVALAQPPGFSAARARNAGFRALGASQASAPVYVQVVDGDCVVEPGWLTAAQAALDHDPALVAVFGRRRERHPETSIYNRLCDDEWNVPVGPALSTGGDAMFRLAALVAVDGFDETLIAGEEPDLCLRLRQAGWRIARIDYPMTVHDAAMTRFGQWWARARRSGWAYGEHVRRHGAQAIPDWTAQVRRIRLWGGWLPGLALASVLAAPLWLPLGLVALAVLGLFAAQTLRLFRRDRARWGSSTDALRAAFFATIIKIPQARGLAQLARDRRRGRQSGLIEYKGAETQPPA